MISGLLLFRWKLRAVTFPLLAVLVGSATAVLANNDAPVYPQARPVAQDRTLALEVQGSSQREREVVAAQRALVDQLEARLGQSGRCLSFESFHPASLDDFNSALLDEGAYQDLKAFFGSDYLGVYNLMHHVETHEAQWRKHPDDEINAYPYVRPDGTIGSVHFSLDAHGAVYLNFGNIKGEGASKVTYAVLKFRTWERVAESIASLGVIHQGVQERQPILPEIERQTLEQIRSLPPEQTLGLARVITVGPHRIRTRLYDHDLHHVLNPQFNPIPQYYPLRGDRPMLKLFQQVG